jgi:hypothetical protein
MMEASNQSSQAYNVLFYHVDENVNDISGHKSCGVIALLTLPTTSELRSLISDV